VAKKKQSVVRGELSRPLETTAGETRLGRELNGSRGVTVRNNSKKTSRGKLERF